MEEVEGYAPLTNYEECDSLDQLQTDYEETVSLNPIIPVQFETDTCPTQSRKSIDEIPSIVEKKKDLVLGPEAVEKIKAIATQFKIRKPEYLN